MLHLRARNQTDTQHIAAAIAGMIRKRDLIVLAGEIGSGKTFFTQAFGRALNITEPITSPTFNLLHSYTTGRLQLHHADLYRLDRTGELVDLGLHDLRERGGVVIVEWGDVVGDALGDALMIHLRSSDDPSKVDERRIDVGDRGGQWATRWIALRESLEAWSRQC